MPIGVPTVTAWPSTTDAVTGSTVEMNPPSWVIDTTGRSTTTPTNDTRPSATAVTAESGSAARSIPRCPAE
ncbi:hypothetical protein JOE66_002467 [Subtercola frigoramans]|uniref:Uncharacterized protein n=1 Tax=Subtercola frigoramans TaxID=120298 RepID=A0ABS2L6X6_9MICO|nr:hypothetical protein [Subtercola frigoramans]MBM7472833.1 hypothetical protein [Subtercola frigoramans]